MSESEEERITRELAQEYSQGSPHLLANACGVHVDDMRRFLRGDAALTAPMRLKIMGHIGTASQEATGRSW